MHYYPRHIGDYMRDAGHLTLIEHGAYTVILDTYYATERGILKNSDLYKSLRAKSREEKAAVDYVLSKFFTLKNDVWVNKRAEQEIKKMKKKIVTAKCNGLKGGRPKIKNSKKILSNFEEKNSKPRKANTDVALEETNRVPIGLAAGLQKKPTGLPIGTRLKANQEPITNNQYKNSKQELDVLNNQVEQIYVALKAKGVVFPNCEKSKVLDLVKKGATINDFFDAMTIAQKKGKGTPYLLGIVKQRMQKKSVPAPGLSLNSKNIRDGVNDDGSF